MTTLWAQLLVLIQNLLQLLEPQQQAQQQARRTHPPMAQTVRSWIQTAHLQLTELVQRTPHVQIKTVLHRSNPITRNAPVMLHLESTAQELVQQVQAALEARLNSLRIMERTARNLMLQVESRLPMEVEQLPPIVLIRGVPIRLLPMRRFVRRMRLCR